MSGDEQARCPFCGGRDWFVQGYGVTVAGGGVRRIYGIWCNFCRARWGGFASAEEARRAWERRSTADVRDLEMRLAKAEGELQKIGGTLNLLGRRGGAAGIYQLAEAVREQVYGGKRRRKK